MNLKSLSDDQLETLSLVIRVHADFSPESFAAFFQLIYGMPLLEHWKKPIEQLFSCFGTEEGMVIEAFRGSAKTTTFTGGLAAYLVGKFPDKSGLLVQVGDDIAGDNSQKVADIIEFNPGWKLVFGDIVPDKEKGWGASGYEVKRTNIPYDEWRQINAQRKDPTFVGVGYKSRAIIGKRPYWLMLDDINDENNTASERENRKVKTILTGTIFPAANFAALRVVIGTPWSEHDALHYCLSTGEFRHTKIPIRIDGELAWPEVFDEKRIKREENLAGPIEFARMYLLDLSKTKGLVLKREWLRWFPHQDINQDWPVVLGVDYTSTEDPRKEKGDYFALAQGRILPGHKGVVLEDGIRIKLSQAEAEQTVVAWAASHHNLHNLGVEAIIQGRNFYNNLMANAEIRAAGIAPYPVTFNKSKGYRFEKLLAPLFQRGRVVVSDADNEFLHAFLEEWISWQGDALEELYPNDALDAVYAMVMAEPVMGFVTPMTRTRDYGNPIFGKKKKESTFETTNWAEY